MQDAVPVRLTSKYNTIMSKHGAYLFGDLMRVRFVNYLRNRVRGIKRAIGIV